MIASLYPEAMTTVADRDKLAVLTRAMGGRVPGSVNQHVWVRSRLDIALGPSSTEPEPLAARMSLPWVIYEKLVTVKELGAI